MEASSWGSFALVIYLPDPLGASIDQFRSTLSGSDGAQAHVTILPPRRLRVPLEAASHETISILNQRKPFEIELAGVHRFPITNLLYLGVSQGQDALRQLHQALNAGALGAAEQFEFQPHLTLGGPLQQWELKEAEQQAGEMLAGLSIPPRFLVEEVVALWSLPDDEGAESWSRIWAYDLARGSLRTHRAATTGRTS